MVRTKKGNVLAKETQRQAAAKRRQGANRRYVRSEGGALIGWTIKCTAETGFLAMRLAGLRALRKDGEPRVFKTRKTATRALREWWNRWQKTVVDTPGLTAKYWRGSSGPGRSATGGAGKTAIYGGR